MSKRYLKLANDIKHELLSIERSINRTLQAWEKFKQTDDQLYLDSVALNLHNFYNGIERLLERIAREIDNNVPKGANWHQQLLEQMSVEIDHKRPAVISFNTRKILEDYRGLRHVVQNIYAFEFESGKLHPLVENSPFILSQVILECQAFATFIEQYK